MMVIGSNRGNETVILLPKTVDYYQEELTRMLESEQYKEAVQLLQFLLDCRMDDPQTYEEWRMLLDWLHASFGMNENGHEGEDDEPELTEQDLYKQRFYAKMTSDPDYVKKLLETVLNDPDLEKKMLAIEQLVVAEHPQIDETLKRWIEQVELHPLIQYKVLQTLCARGASGTVELNRAGEQVVLEIAETPLDTVHFTDSINQVIEQVRRICEIDQPSLVYFAEHTWREFLAYIYGTSIYREMAGMSLDETAAWAAALHQAVVLSMSGNLPKPEALLPYELPDQLMPGVQYRRERLLAFMHNTFIY